MASQTSLACVPELVLFMRRELAHRTGGVDKIQYHEHHWDIVLRRLGSLAFLFATSIAWQGCSDRPVTEHVDDLRELCVEHCSVGFECGINTSNSQEGCVAGCVPRARERLATCAEDIELSWCWAQLSCTEVESYDIAFREFFATLEYPEEFPCREQFITYMDMCVGADELSR